MANSSVTSSAVQQNTAADSIKFRFICYACHCCNLFIGLSSHYVMSMAAIAELLICIPEVAAFLSELMALLDCQCCVRCVFDRDVDLFAAGDMVVPATPGSMLKSSSYSSRSGSVVDVGSDWLTIQRQVAKLTCRVERLEEENGRRHQREMLLYPLLLGFCLVQLARFLVSRSK